MRTFLLSTFCFLALITLEAQTIVRGPYLQAATTNSIVIRWRTSAASVGRVQYGPSPNNLVFTVDEAAATTEHAVQLTGLQADAQYYYAVGTDTSLLSGPDAGHYFRTFPVPGTIRPYRIWAIGDFGKGNTLQREVREAFEQYDAAQETDLWLWLGDNAYSDGTDQEFQAKVFSGPWGYQELFKRLPFQPIPGNHDYNLISPAQATVDPNNHSGVYFDIVNVYTQGEAGGAPSNNELYYSFDYGNIHFICLNSELGSVLNPNHDWTGANLIFPFNGSPMMDWLEADLAQNTQPWTIVTFHQPPYSKGSHDSDDIWERYMKAMRENWLPVLEQAGVDLVLNGHSHVYERSYLVQGHYGNSGSWNAQTMLVDGSSGNPNLNESYIKDSTNRGTVYVVTGNSGSSESGPELNHPVYYYNYGCDTCTGSTIIEVHGDTLTGKFLTKNGQVIDEYRVLKNVPTGTVRTPRTLHSYNIFPNPTNGLVSLQTSFAQATNLEVTLYDRAGQKVKPLFVGEIARGQQTLSLDLGQSGLAAGLYFVACSADGSVRYLPVVVD